jgi:hypothetical protein
MGWLWMFECLNIYNTYIIHLYIFYIYFIYICFEILDHLSSDGMACCEATVIMSLQHFKHSNNQTFILKIFWKQTQCLTQPWYLIPVSVSVSVPVCVSICLSLSLSPSLAFESRTTQFKQIRIQNSNLPGIHSNRHLRIRLCPLRGRYSRRACFKSKIQKLKPVGITLR